MSQFFNAGDEVVVRQYDDMMLEFGHVETNEKDIAVANVFTYGMRKYCGEYGVVEMVKDSIYHGRTTQLLDVRFYNRCLSSSNYIFSNEMFEPINQCRNHHFNLDDLV